MMDSLKLTEDELVIAINEAVSWVLGNEKEMPNSVSKLIDRYCKSRHSYEKCIGSGTEGKKFIEYKLEYDKFKNGEDVSQDFMEKLFSTYKNTIDSLNTVSNKDARKFSVYKDIEKQLKSRGFDTEELYKKYIGLYGD